MMAGILEEGITARLDISNLTRKLNSETNAFKQIRELTDTDGNIKEHTIYRLEDEIVSLPHISPQHISTPELTTEKLKLEKQEVFTPLQICHLRVLLCLAFLQIVPPLLQN